MKKPKIQLLFTKQTLQIVSLIFWIIVLLMTSCKPEQPIIPLFDEQGENILQTRQAQAIEFARDTITAQHLSDQLDTPTPYLEVNPQYTFTQTEFTSTLTPEPITSTPTLYQSNPSPTWTYDKDCNVARLIQEINFPDGSFLLPGENFTKIWRLQNIGNCTWTTEYKVTFVIGDQLGAELTYDLPHRVRPGEKIDIAIPMVAPDEKGTYAGHWMLSNEAGGRFGVGTGGKSTFWVGINVFSDAGSKYDFSNELCDATWTSGYGSTKINLPCPGLEGSITTGYAVRAIRPIREDEGLENEIGMITRPYKQNGGYIQGKYPAIIIENGDTFKTVLNCQHESLGCDIYFELRYQIGNGSVQSLGRWHEVYDGLMQSIEVDLSSLAGKSVNFILFVENGALSDDNRALWIRPTIRE